MDCPAAFKDILSGFSVHKGDRGEILVLLFQMMARDQAVSPSESRSYARFGCSCTVPDFLKALFEPEQEKILPAQGMVLTAKGCTRYHESLEVTFEDTTVYCTHWLKLHQHKIVSTRYLVRLFARGAAVLCGNNHPGIDGVMPYLYKSTTLAASNIGAILWQSKNDEKYGNNPQVDLFTSMDPYSTGLFDEPTDVPVIRIVFALAAKEPSIEIVTTGESKSGKKFTTYDIWVAGLGPEIFGVMTDKGVWEALLQASYGWRDMYKGVDAEEAIISKQMTPGLAEDDPFWDLWVDNDAEKKI
ncbi:hypothetical protein H1R20_g9635, partial [Candolleomyces eurysporus]